MMKSTKRSNQGVPVWAIVLLGVALMMVSANCEPVSKPLVTHEYRLTGEPDISTEQLRYTFAEGDEQELLAATKNFKDLRSQVAGYNSEILKAFGYSLKDYQQHEYTNVHWYANLFHGEELVAANIDFMTPISVNRSKTDFIGFVDLADGNRYLFTRDRFEQVPWGADRQVYCFVNDQLLSVEVTATADQKEKVDVYLDDEKVYSSELFYGRPTYGSIDGPRCYNGHWALVLLDGRPSGDAEIEFVPRLVQDGEDINEKLGYEESFQFAVLDQRPFYFFQKDGKIDISFDGQQYARGYEEIPYYNCCSPAMLNPGISMNMIWFFARRGADWYYVEAYVPVDEGR